MNEGRMLRCVTILPLMFLAGCYRGDPRTTKIENNSPDKISVSYLDGGFNIRDSSEVEPNKVGDLWPNYQLARLQELQISTGRTRYRLTKEDLATLSNACSGFCTLTYRGGGRVGVRPWKGFKNPR
jgi:hypothetical protein